ncbi:MAG: hypothetical protein JWS12_412 [Candidatus Saccharibacteria bacterium]|nr:hypothetical protein [Candidatus Saccharibacteria bacterium]
MKKLNQQGIVSIVVTMVILTVLTLITVGFAIQTRREQRQSIDKQLSSQAFYAAESGINDAASAIQQGQLPGNTKLSCDPNPVGQPLSNYRVGSDPAVKITCLTVSNKVKSIEYGTVKNLKSIFVPIETADLSHFTTLTIGWSATAQPTILPTGNKGEFPDASGWPPANLGLLRMALTKIDGVPLQPDALANATMTAFLYPTGARPSDTFTFDTAVGNQGNIYDVHCTPPAVGSTTRDCLATITFSTPDSSKYYLRLSSIYKDSAVTITCTSIASASDCGFQNAQASVDATGKAQDVLRRVQVRIPLNATYNIPEFAIESGGALCKTLDVSPGNVSGGGGNCNPF